MLSFYFLGGLRPINYSLRLRLTRVTLTQCRRMNFSERHCSIVFGARELVFHSAKNNGSVTPNVIRNVAVKTLSRQTISLTQKKGSQI
jgi:hypothetical protein